MIKILCLLIIVIISIICIITINEGYEDNNNSIPKVIYLTYKTKNIPDYVIPNWKKLNPDYDIKLHDDNDCIKFLKQEYGDLYVDIFNYIKDGPIKSDFWRCCILYKYGGVYGDIDMEPLLPISSLLENNINFYTCKSGNTNPSIIISTKNNKIIKYCIDTYINKYINKEKYEYWPWSITNIMNKSLINYLQKNNIKGNNKYNDVKLFIEKGGTSKPGKNYDNYIEYKGKRIFNNRYRDYDSLNHTFNNL